MLDDADLQCLRNTFSCDCTFGASLICTPLLWLGCNPAAYNLFQPLREGWRDYVSHHPVMARRVDLIVDNDVLFDGPGGFEVRRRRWLPLGSRRCTLAAPDVKTSAAVGDAADTAAHHRRCHKRLGKLGGA